MTLTSEGLANQAYQLYTVSQNLSLQVATLNASLVRTRIAVNRTREEANVFSELRNETENSVALTLNQVSQLQIASGIIMMCQSLHYIFNFRCCTESSECCPRFC